MEESDQSFTLLQRRRLQLNQTETVKFVSYSPKIDVIILATVKRILVYRVISWERIYVKSISAESIAWRPDGRLFAVSEETSTLVRIYELESGKEIEIGEVKMTSLKWNAMEYEAQGDDINSNSVLTSMMLRVSDPAIDFPKLELSNGSTAEQLPVLQIFEQDYFNSSLQNDFLIGMKNSSCFQVLAFGCLPCVFIQFSEAESSNLNLLDFAFSNDCSLLLVCKEQNKILKAELYEIPILRDDSVKLNGLFQWSIRLQQSISFLLLSFQTVEKHLDVIRKSLRLFFVPLQKSSESLHSELKILLYFGAATKALDEGFCCRNDNRQRLELLKKKFSESFLEITKICTSGILRAIDQIFIYLKQIQLIALDDSQINANLEIMLQQSTSLHNILVKFLKEISEAKSLCYSLATWFQSLHRYNQLHDLSRNSEEYENQLKDFVTDPLPEFSRDLIKQWINGKSSSQVGDFFSFNNTFKEISTVDLTWMISLEDLTTNLKLFISRIPIHCSKNISVVKKIDLASCDNTTIPKVAYQNNLFGIFCSTLQHREFTAVFINEQKDVIKRTIVFQDFHIEKWATGQFNNESTRFVVSTEDAAGNFCLQTLDVSTTLAEKNPTIINVDERGITGRRALDLTFRKTNHLYYFFKNEVVALLSGKELELYDVNNDDISSDDDDGEDFGSDN